MQFACVLSTRALHILWPLALMSCTDENLWGDVHVVLPTNPTDYYFQNAQNMEGIENSEKIPLAMNEEYAFYFQEYQSNGTTKIIIIDLYAKSILKNPYPSLESIVRVSRSKINPNIEVELRNETTPKNTQELRKPM